PQDRDLPSDQQRQSGRTSRRAGISGRARCSSELPRRGPASDGTSAAGHAPRRQSAWARTGQGQLSPISIVFGRRAKRKVSITPPRRTNSTTPESLLVWHSFVGDLLHESN